MKVERIVNLCNEIYITFSFWSDQKYEIMKTLDENFSDEEIEALKEYGYTIEELKSMI